MQDDDTLDVEPVESTDQGDVLTLDLPGDITGLSVSKRRLGLRIVPYGVVADSRYGPLMFEAGAFGQVDPREVRLRMDHADPPTGKGVTFEERGDGAYMEFAVSKTQRGDEQLTLATDGVSAGASVGYRERGGSRIRSIGGRSVRVYPPNSASLDEVSTTWQPTFEQAAVTYILAKGEEEGVPIVAEQEAPATGAQTEDVRHMLTAFEDRSRAQDDKLDKVLSAFGDWRERFEEMARQNFAVPRGEEKRKARLDQWVEVALRRMRGQIVSPTELKALALDDIVTDQSDQQGLVPAAFTPDYDDLINQDRPFLTSTRQVVPPATGTSMTLPIITQRAVAGTQDYGEKTELTTTATRVGTGTFAYVAVFGGADISIQMINRAEASFFDILTGDMGMAYALDCDSKAIAALLAGYTDSASGGHQPVDGGTMDPENLLIGAAWQNSIAVYKRAPDTMWMSAAAVAAFIDAKAPLTNGPLYSNLAAAFTAAGGPGGTLSGLRPVYVPALDAEAVDVIVGPSRGFVWAEDPARRLQTDVPSKAGRDIALVGGLFPAPRFADAFTYYVIGS